MNESIEIIRLNINGRWSAEEMSKSLLHLSELYNLRLFLQLSYEDFRDFEKYYFEFMHFPPFRKKFKRFSSIPFMHSLYSSYPFLPSDPNEIINISKRVFPSEQLNVRRIEYGSPGFQDLSGFGEIIGHIKDFILRIIEMKNDKRKRDLENQERELKNQQLRIDNAQKLVSLAKDCGYDSTELRKLIYYVDEKQETFVHLIENGKIESVETPDEKNSNQ